MALFLPKQFYTKDFIYINGQESILYFIEICITIITAISNGKPIYRNYSKKHANHIDIIVYTWEKHYHSSFFDFIDNLNYFFRYKGVLPYYCKLNRNIRENVTEYSLEIVYRYYHYLDKMFQFPNVNTVIMSLIDKFCKIKPQAFKPKCLQLCKFIKPLRNRYIIWNDPKELPQKELIQDGPSLMDKFEQLEHKKDMYSSMLDYIHFLSQRVSSDELIKQISEVHSIKTANLYDPSKNHD